MTPTGDLACRPGTCPDWESNQVVCRPVLSPLSHASQGCVGFEVILKSVAWCLSPTLENYWPPSNTASFLFYSLLSSSSSLSLSPFPTFFPLPFLLRPLPLHPPLSDFSYQYLDISTCSHDFFLHYMSCSLGTSYRPFSSLIFSLPVLLYCHTHLLSS